jgi:pyridoxamine 5'-phosphate oxidase
MTGFNMANRRQFLTTTAVLGAAAEGGFWSSALAQTPSSAPSASPPPAAADAPPGINDSRGSAPGPWSVPSENPDPNQWRKMKVKPVAPIVHADFVLSPSADPLQLFAEWFRAARAAGEPSPEDMTLSTVDSSGMPDSRMMLLHWINDGRFQFSSYDTSPKGKQLKAHPKAALLFYWKKTGQVVRVRGTVKKFTAAQSRNLWPIKRDSMTYRLHDLVVYQSEVIKGPDELEQRMGEAEKRYTDPDAVPMRDWTGWFLTPLAIEFFRPISATVKVERLRFSRSRSSDPWLAERLAP